MKTPTLCLGLLTALLAVTALSSLMVGAVAIPPDRVASILWNGTGSGASSADLTIIWQLRLPRILLACLVGAGLGTAGAGYQGLFRNPLADPFIIGDSSGAALGATVAIVTGLQAGALGLTTVPLCALTGSLLSVAMVYALASVGRQVSCLSFLLAGVATSSFLGAIVSLLMFLHDEKLVTIFGWLMGSLSGRGWSTLKTAAPLILAGSVTLSLLARSLDALTFGEETAMSLGVRLGRLRSLVVVAASLATAACVATAGIVGFVGLISPHLARLLVGARHVWVIPASGILGALLLLGADDLARTLNAPGELPVGLLAHALGTPFFLGLLKTRQRELGAGL